jgi:hypothetical protein
MFLHSHVRAACAQNQSHARTHTRTYIDGNILTRAHAPARTHACRHARTDTHAHVYVRKHTQAHTHARTHNYTRTHAHAHTDSHARTHSRTRTHDYTQTDTRTRTRDYTHARAHSLARARRTWLLQAGGGSGTSSLQRGAIAAIVAVGSRARLARRQSASARMHAPRIPTLPASKQALPRGCLRAHHARALAMVCPRVSPPASTGERSLRRATRHAAWRAASRIVARRRARADRRGAGPLGPMGARTALPAGCRRARPSLRSVARRSAWSGSAERLSSPAGPAVGRSTDRRPSVEV